MQELFRAIPSMDICLKAIKDENADLARLPQNLLKDLVTDFWNMIRVLIREKKITDASSLAIENQLGPLLAHVRKKLRPVLRRVLNATGVIIHTNLGRSILAREASEAAMMAASGYCNLEMNLATGERGSRHDITEEDTNPYYLRGMYEKAMEKPLFREVNWLKSAEVFVFRTSWPRAAPF